MAFLSPGLSSRDISFSIADDRMGSDHFPIQISLDKPLKRNTPLTEPRYRFDKTNDDSVHNTLKDSLTSIDTDITTQDELEELAVTLSYNYTMRFTYSNLLIHILSLSNEHNNVASIQKNRDDKSHRVIVALCDELMKAVDTSTPKTYSRNDPKFPISQAILDLIKEKRGLRRLYNNTHDPDTKSIRNKLQKNIRTK